MSQAAMNMEEQLDIGNAPPLRRMDEEMAVKLILPKRTTGIYSRQEVYEGLEHVVPLHAANVL